MSSARRKQPSVKQLTRRLATANRRITKDKDRRAQDREARRNQRVAGAVVGALEGLVEEEAQRREGRE